MLCIVRFVVEVAQVAFSVVQLLRLHALQVIREALSLSIVVRLLLLLVLRPEVLVLPLLNATVRYAYFHHPLIPAGLVGHWLYVRCR
jgi:hypothetical protein